MMDQHIQEAVTYVRAQSDFRPTLGLILGSGLSDIAELAVDPVIIDTSDIPHYPASTVEGHKGRLILGSIRGKDVAFVQGRLHVYEGHSVSASTFPVRLLSGLGVSRLIVTNAAGGIKPSLKPGSLMWIQDHINWTYQNPRIGQTDSRSNPQVRSKSMYDRNWLIKAQQIAADEHIETDTGTYLWTLGPSYETKAEIRAFKMLGADAVGMSTVPEVIEANACGMRVLGLSTITNFAAGLSTDSLNHEEVLDVGRQVRSRLEKLVLNVVERA